jgi:tRNA threonylcarbamoyladenosine modification (KEOPS) complex Cgi121 subunit
LHESSIHIYLLLQYADQCREDIFRKIKVEKSKKTAIEIYKLSDTFASIIGIQAIQIKDTGKVIDDLRYISNKVSFQAIDAKIVYNIEQIIEVLKITLESEKRKIMVASKPEMDLLLRLCCTDQISHALRYGGLKNNTNSCFIIFSKDKKQLLKVVEYVKRSFEVNDAILKPSKAKRKMISHNIGLSTSKIFDHRFFIGYLLEKASLITK